MTCSAKGIVLPPCSVAGVLEAGTDEAGRGCLAGPVYAAAVILPEDFAHPAVNDSKKLTASKRMELRRYIMENAVAWAIASASAKEIDSINILRASILAMHRALDGLKVRPQRVIVDGNRFTAYADIPFETFVKGDGRFANIAAASILAKTERDLFMERIAGEYPVYGWDINKGYPTAAHREAIAAHGLCPYHRKTFRSAK